MDKEKVKKYLNDRKCGVIATCKDNKPRASTVRYYPDGWIIYFSTSPDSTKIANIKANENVSIAVDDQYNGTGCFQADGIATILAEAPAKFKNLKGTIVKVELKKISFVDKSDKEGFIRFEV